MKKLTTKKIIALIAFLAVIIGVVVVILLPKHIETVEAKNMEISPTVKGTGYVAGDSEHTVYASVSGIVSEAYAKVGDRVKEDSVLVSYNGEAQKRALDLAKADAEYSQKILEAARANRDKYQDKYDDALERDSIYENRYAELVSQIRELDTKGYLNTVSVQNKHNEYQREIEEIQKKLAGKQTELQAVQYNLSVAQLEADADKFKNLTEDAKKLADEIESFNSQILNIQIEELKLPLENLSTDDYNTYIAYQQQLEVVSREWAQARSDKDTSQSMLTALQEIYANEQLVAQSQLSLDTAQTEMNRANSGDKASVSGIITQKLVDKGSAVEKGQPIYIMQSTNYYRVRMKVSKFDISKIKVDQKAKVTIGDKEYSGKVVDISQSAVSDDAGKPKVYVDIKIDTTEALIVGFEAEVEVSLGQINDALCVPSESVYSDDNGSYVYIVKDGVLEKTYVTVGAEDGKYIQIVSGIGAGAKVANSPEAADYEGKRVG